MVQKCLEEELRGYQFVWVRQLSKKSFFIFKIQAKIISNQNLYWVLDSNGFDTNTVDVS